MSSVRRGVRGGLVLLHQGRDEIVIVFDQRSEVLLVDVGDVFPQVLREPAGEESWFRHYLDKREARLGAASRERMLLSAVFMVQTTILS